MMYIGGLLSNSLIYISRLIGSLQKMLLDSRKPKIDPKPYILECSPISFDSHILDGLLNANAK